MPNNSIIPTSDIVRYLTLHLDKRLTWHLHTKLKLQILTESTNSYFARVLDIRSKLSLITDYRLQRNPEASLGLWHRTFDHHKTFQLLQTADSSFFK